MLQQTEVSKKDDVGADTVPLVIDVRSPKEFAGKHISSTINIPHTRIGSEIEAYAKDKSRCIIVYCHGGARADSAEKELLSMGYTNIENLGGYAKAEKLLGALLSKKNQNYA